MPLPAWPRCSVRTSSLSFLLESANYVSSPRSALHEREDEQDAHRQVLQRVREAVRDGVHGGARAGVRAGYPSEDHGEGDQEDDDDQACDADGGEVLQIPDSDLPGVVQGHEGKRDGAERRHDVELQRSSPAHDQGDDVGGQHHHPADERDDEHGQQRRDVVVGGDDGHRRKVQCAAGPEQRHDPVDGDANHLVDRLHQLEAVLDQEQEHGEEDEQEHDLLDPGHRRVAVDPLRDLDELHGEHEGEHAAADGKDGDPPHAVGDVVHRHASGGGQHRAEVGAEDAVVSDSLEDVDLLGEHPVRGIPQELRQPVVDVPGDVGVGAVRRNQQHREEGESHREGDFEAAVTDGFVDDGHLHHIAEILPVLPSIVTVTMVALGSSRVKVELVLSLLASM